MSNSKVLNPALDRDPISSIGSSFSSIMSPFGEQIQDKETNQCPSGIQARFAPLEMPAWNPNLRDVRQESHERHSCSAE